jgi:oligoribonuclease
VRFFFFFDQFVKLVKIDVSTIKELTKRWYPTIASGVVKKAGHRALDDIIESIEELKYYKEHVFIK